MWEGKRQLAKLPRPMDVAKGNSRQKKLWRERRRRKEDGGDG